MKTSYFAKMKCIENPISICGKAPDWYKGIQYKKLAPKFWFFDLYKKGKIDTDGYTKAYKEEVLDKLDPHEVYKEITSKFEGEPTLLCYEKPTDFCHRHLVAKWFNDAGYDVEELEFK